MTAAVRRAGRAVPSLLLLAVTAGLAVSDHRPTPTTEQILNEPQAASQETAAAVIIRVHAPPSPSPDCPRGWICFYAAPGYGWPRARTRACGLVDLQTAGWADRVRSVHNNLAPGAHDAGHAGLYHYTVADPDPLLPADAWIKLTVPTAAGDDVASISGPVDYLYRRC